MKPAIVLDNGTGFTKLGFSGNLEPNALIPTFIATRNHTSQNHLYRDASDLDYYIGEDAQVPRPDYNLDFPIREGVVSNWSNMEKYLQRCVYQQLRVNPEDHMFLMTEPPLNPPENREYLAEIMFETFNVPGLNIAVQAVLALYASMLNVKKTSLDKDGTSHSTSDNAEITGTVIDSGDGVTHIVPVVSGFVIGSCIRHIPLAGRTVTNFIVDQLRSRNENVPADQILHVARSIKEQYCYVCPDLVKEYNKYDANPSKHFVKHTHRVVGGKGNNASSTIEVDVGYERFLGPELFFNPEIFSSDFATPLPDVVDQVIQSCPIDTRTALYKYITLSGGSTLFRNFTKRIERDIRVRVKTRYDYMIEKYYSDSLQNKDGNGNENIVDMIDVNVITHPFQRFAVWFGGSMLAMQPDAHSIFHTREDYLEYGPRIARSNVVFNSI